MSEELTIAVIIPLVITTFIIGNYTLYERTIAQADIIMRYLIVTSVFIVQEYVIIFLSNQIVGYIFYQYAIAVLMFNLLNNKYYGVYVACLTPILVNAYLLIAGQTTTIQWSLFSGLVLFIAVTGIGSQMAPRGSYVSLPVQMVIINIIGPCTIAANPTTKILTISQYGHYLAELTFGSILLLVVYQFFLNGEVNGIDQFKEAYHDSMFDALTGLGNYRALLEYAEKVAKGAGETVICIIDVDHFKGVNDKYGHKAGNVALQYFANYLATSTGVWEHRTSRAFRYGGEEFCIVFSGLSMDEFPEIIDCIKTRQRLFMSQPFSIKQGEQLPLSFSAGVTLWRKGEAMPLAFERADTALYEAKRNGRSQVRIFNGGAGLASVTKVK